jgi:RNA recognition motif-containing protein
MIQSSKTTVVKSMGKSFKRVVLIFLHMLYPIGEEMETKLYVGNLAYNANENELKELFGKAGVVSEVIMIKDRDTGRSKGFAFVTMGSQTEVETAIQMFNDQDFGGRPLKVSIARPREERSNRGGSGGGGRGRGGQGQGQSNRRDNRRDDRW